MEPTYQSVMRMFATQPLTEVFAHFHYQPHKGESFSTPMERLAKSLQPEDWSQRGGVDNYGLLRGYLNQVFLYVQSKNMIVESTCGGFACFHTGLCNRAGLDLYGFFLKNTKGDGSREAYLSLGFRTCKSGLARHFSALPSRPDFSVPLGMPGYPFQPTRDIAMPDRAMRKLYFVCSKHGVVLTDRELEHLLTDAIKQVKQNPATALIGSNQGIHHYLFPIRYEDNLIAVGMIDICTQTGEYECKTVINIETAKVNRRLMAGASAMSWLAG